MDTLGNSGSVAKVFLGSTRAGLRIGAALFVLAGLIAGALTAPRVSAQTTAVVEIRVHSCPDDLDATGFFQHLTQCTSERGLYGVALGLETSQLAGPEFQYSQPDDTGRAALMSWPSVNPGTVTVTEVAPDPIRPSVAFCSLQPSSGGPLSMDGEEVPLNDGVMTIELDEGDTLMCDWYRFPGGVTAGDEGDGDDGDGDDQGTGDDQGDGEEDAGDGNDDDGQGDDEGNGDDDGAGAGAVEGVIYDPDGSDGDNPDLAGSQIFIQKWDCVDGEQIDGRPEILDTSSADGLAELEDACELSESAFQFALRDEIVEGGDQPAEQDEGDEAEFQGIVAEDGTIVDEEGGPDEAVAGGPTGEGDDAGNQGIVADDEEDAGAEDDPAGVGDDEGAVGVYPPLEIGGITEYEGWNGLSAGPYIIQESVPDGFGQPLVLCDGIFAGAQAGDNIFELTAIDGAVIYDLSEGEMLLCRWFNVVEPGADGGLGDENEEGEEGEDGETGEDTGEGEIPPVDEDDLDADGIGDTEETGTYGTDPTNPDSDGDGLSDGEEINLYFSNPLEDDTDADGLPDFNEAMQHGTDPNNPDSDGDGVNDHDETLAETDPLDPDS